MIGLVLAGGQSRRFGVDKATYAFANHLPNVVIAVNRLRPLCDSILVVANRSNQAQITRLVNGPQITIILDPPAFAGQGPVAGILAACATHQQERQEILLSPCDYPDLTAGSLALLAQRNNHYLRANGKDHYTLAHITVDQAVVQEWLMSGQRRLKDFLKGALHCQPLLIDAPVKEFINHNQRSSVSMKNMQEMTPADFQKLITLVLSDLTIRRTLLENREREVNQEMRSLEKDAELEELDNQIQAIQADYNHYREYLDPNFKLDLDQYYRGMK